MAITPTVKPSTSAINGIRLWGNDFAPCNQEIDELEAILPKADLEKSWNEGEAATDAASDTAGTVSVEKKEISPLIRLPAGQMRQRRFEVLQQWEGVVTELSGQKVWADLKDLTDRSNPDEVIELPIDEFSPGDRDVLGKGSVFYWAIGYEARSGGQRTRVSEIRVSRMPRWSKREIAALKYKAEKLMVQMNAYAEQSNTTP